MGKQRQFKVFRRTTLIVNCSMKFYRYLIYRIYTWRIKVKDEVPVNTTLVTLSLLHIVQLATIWNILESTIPELRGKLSFSTEKLIILLLLFLVAYSLLVYKKKRWKQYVEEFQNEDLKMRKRGTFFVRLYIFGTILIFLFCMVFFGLVFW